MSARKVLILTALFAGAINSSAGAQTTSNREGLWFNIGMGVLLAATLWPMLR